MVSLDWIAKHMKDGKDFKPLARRAMASLIGEVFYVDLVAGTDDGASTDSFDRAFLTVNYAFDECTADGNDYVLVKGFKTETGSGVVTTMDVAETHMIGHTGILNPYYPEKGTLYRDGAGNAPYVLITAEFCEFAGFSVNALQSSGAESTTVTKSALNLGTDADGGGNKAFVHNVHFPDWGDTANVTGLSVHGTHYFVLRDIVVDSPSGNFDTGIRIDGAQSSNSAQATLERIYCQGGVGGAFTQAIKLGSGSNLQNSRIDGLRVQRCTNAINLGAAYGAYVTVSDVIAGCAEASIFTGGSTCNGRSTLWSNYKWLAGENVSGNDAWFGDT